MPKGMNVLYLDDGKQVKIIVDHEDGFITKMQIEGELQVQPPSAIKEIEKHLANSHLTTVAIYTRLRFFMLKNNVTFANIDPQTLAEGIAACQEHQMQF